MMSQIEITTEKHIYDGLSVEIIETAPQGVLCGSDAQVDGLTVTGVSSGFSSPTATASSATSQNSSSSP